MPERVWSGAGVVVRKVHHPAKEAAGVLVNVGRSFSLVHGKVLPRWVLVVQDDANVDHYVNVGPSIWAAHEVGDVISPDCPLIDIRE